MKVVFHSVIQFLVCWQIWTMRLLSQNCLSLRLGCLTLSSLTLGSTGKCRLLSVCLNLVPDQTRQMPPSVCSSKEENLEAVFVMQYVDLIGRQEVVQAWYQKLCESASLVGRVRVARDGVNVTVSPHRWWSHGKLWKRHCYHGLAGVAVTVIIICGTRLPLVQ